MTKDELIKKAKYLVKYKGMFTEAEYAAEVVAIAEEYSSSQNNGKPLVSGSLLLDELLLSAIKYGYDYHKTTSFPDQSFEDNMKGNALQWIENRRQ